MVTIRRANKTNGSYLIKCKIEWVNKGTIERNDSKSRKKGRNEERSKVKNAIYPCCR